MLEGLLGKALLGLVVVAAVAGGVTLIYTTGVSAGKNSCLAQQKAIDDAVTAANDKFSKTAADAIAGIEMREITINRRIEREVRTNTVYADCRHAPGMLDDLNEALTGRRSDRPRTPVVPAASAPGR